MAKANNRDTKKQGNKPAPAAASPPPPPAPAEGLETRPPTSSIIWRWFASRTARQANAMRRHVEKLLNHQRDILSPQAIAALQGAITVTRNVIASGADKATLEKQMESLENTANKWLKPYPNAAWRENIEVLLVALTVAMGIRTFFLQPFKIPTGSMQPTLYGVTSVPDYSQVFDVPADAALGKFPVPHGWDRIREWFGGVSYVHVKAKIDGELSFPINAPFKILIFNVFQTLKIGGVNHWILFPPDYGGSTLEKRAGLRPDRIYKKGEEVVRMKVINGDHLFVDRLTYNFRPPTRGEIIVFETRGIQMLPQDQFYIKRMVAMGGDKIQIGDDRHLVINGSRLDASTPHFEKVYSFDPKQPPRESRYSGHVNEKVARQYEPNAYRIAPLFPDGSSVYDVPPEHYMVMGDNTMNSFDSRAWGAFPATNVIGKSFFVYWPISDRFGWGYHR